MRRRRSCTFVNIQRPSPGRWANMLSTNRTTAPSCTQTWLAGKSLTYRDEFLSSSSDLSSQPCFILDCPIRICSNSPTMLPYGYGSIPINTIFRGMNIHLPAILMFTRGTRVLTHCHIPTHEGYHHGEKRHDILHLSRRCPKDEGKVFRGPAQFSLVIPSKLAHQGPLSIIRIEVKAQVGRFKMSQ